MLTRRLLLLALLTALAFALAWLKIRRVVSTSAAPAPATEQPVEIPIEEGKTIDFSSGQPQVRNEAADRAALEKALAEIKAAEAEVVLPPRPSPQP